MPLISLNQEDSLAALNLDALTARLAEAERLLAERTDALDALHRWERSLQEAQRVAKIGSWEFDPAANKITWSAEMFRLTGLDPADGEPDYQTLMTHYHPDDVASHDAAVLQALDDGLPFEFEIRVLCGEGMMRWGRIAGQAGRDEHGRIVRLFGTMMDITERREAEEENARLAAIVESSHDAVLAATLDGTLVSWNASAERLFGYRESEIIGQHISVLAPPGKPGFNGSVVQPLRRGEMCENLEVRRRKDGTLIDLVITFSPVCNPAGEMVGVAAICRDMTAQRQAEDAVRRSEGRLAEAQRIAQIGSWEADTATGKITLSEEMRRLLEIPADVPVTHDLVISRYHPDDLGAYHATTATSVTDARPFAIDIRVVRAGGGVRWCHAVGKPVFDGDGSLVRWAGTMMDITERVLVEERFRVLFEHSSEAHFFMGPHGMIDCNGAALQMLRCGRKTDLLSLDPRCLSPERQPDGSLSVVKELLMEEAARAYGSHRFEWTHTRMDGTEFPTEIILTPVTLGGSPAMLAVWHDLTERKKAEQQIRDYAIVLEAQKQELELVNRELCDLATTDGLTGLKNHRAFQERLAAECETARRHRTPLSLLLLDVDHFKQYNDAYGHPAGDAVLKQVADLLTHTTRDCDFAGRYGGEEFVVILPKTSQSSAIKAAERCRSFIESAEWNRRAVTASFGVATLSLDIPDGESLLAAADRALYAAKYNGRNQVMASGNLYLQEPDPSNLVVLSG